MSCPSGLKRKNRIIDEVLDKLCHTEMAQSVLFSSPQCHISTLAYQGAERNEQHRERPRPKVVEFSGRIRTESIFETLFCGSRYNRDGFFPQQCFFLYCVASPSTGSSVGTVQLEAHIALCEVDQIHLKTDFISSRGWHQTGINYLSCQCGCYSLSNLKDVERVTGKIMATSCFCLTV